MSYGRIKGGNIWGNKRCYYLQIKKHPGDKNYLGTVVQKKSDVAIVSTPSLCSRDPSYFTLFYFILFFDFEGSQGGTS